MRKSKPTKSPAVQEEVRGQLGKAVAEQDGKVCDIDEHLFYAVASSGNLCLHCLSFPYRKQTSASSMESFEAMIEPPLIYNPRVVARTWENVVEGADGTISSTVEGLLEAGKRKR